MTVVLANLQLTRQLDSFDVECDLVGITQSCNTSVLFQFWRDLTSVPLDYSQGVLGVCTCQRLS